MVQRRPDSARAGPLDRCGQYRPITATGRGRLDPGGARRFSMHQTSTSVVVENRELAAQLLAAADLWLFVTSAARYADAVPWDFLNSAAERSAAVAVVLDRVPRAMTEVPAHLGQMMSERGLGASPLFAVP